MDLKRQKIVGEVMSGKTLTAIAEEMGVHRSSVSEILNSDETKKLIERLEGKLKSMGPKSLDALAKVLELQDDPEKCVESLKAAIPILKSIGIIKDKVDISHTFPKAHIIERLDGSTVELGVGDDNEE